MGRLHRAASRAISRCLSSSPIPFLLSEASLPRRQVTLTHFTLLSYERALCIPTSFPISGLARLGVKPRLCRSFWRAFATTHPLILFSTILREALAYPSFPPWNLSSFTAESTLSSPCSRSDPLSLTLTLSHLTIWCFGQTALFFFTKAALAYLPSVLSVALRPLFSFQQAQYALVFPLKPAPLCKVFASLGSTNKFATFNLFSYLTLALSSPPCSFLHLSFYLDLFGKNYLLSAPLLSGYNWSLNTRFSRGTTRLMSWPDGLELSAIACSLSLRISRIHSSLFSD